MITPLEATNMGPGFNRGSGGGAWGCGFEERVRAYARTEGGDSYSPRSHTHSLSLSLCVCLLIRRFAFSNTPNKLSRPIFKHAQHTHADPTLPRGDMPNTRVLPQALARSTGRRRVPRVAPTTLGAGAGGGAPPSSPPSHFTEHDIYDQELGRPMRVKG